MVSFSLPLRLFFFSILVFFFPHGFFSFRRRTEYAGTTVKSASMQVAHKETATRTKTNPMTNVLPTENQ